MQVIPTHLDLGKHILGPLYFLVGLYFAVAILLGIVAKFIPRWLRGMVALVGFLGIFALWAVLTFHYHFFGG
ncbi:hypothetical protein [Alicyclobacillus sp. ALC3]|uniref:hypothetical protein n=1 Tax=Alicyclobacillus sp. ALC3 TaxID=2796143 RepID=UPI00237831A8|nr:hypothetical protein [Alicyclobacillus sp. ALC3]WDL99786.1 hypothetical protein JC200_23735 [Alicyclobacillus sp. ALC3]